MVSSSMKKKIILTVYLSMGTIDREISVGFFGWLFFFGFVKKVMGDKLGRLVDRKMSKKILCLNIDLVLNVIIS